LHSTTTAGGGIAWALTVLTVVATVSAVGYGGESSGPAGSTTGSYQPRNPDHRVVVLLVRSQPCIIVVAPNIRKPLSTSSHSKHESHIKKAATAVRSMVLSKKKTKKKGACV
jgi:hypothetical protein